MITETDMAHCKSAVAGMVATSLPESREDELARRLKQLVLDKPLMSEAMVRQEILEQCGQELEVVEVSQLLSR